MIDGPVFDGAVQLTDRLVDEALVTDGAAGLPGAGTSSTSIVTEIDASPPLPSFAPTVTE